MIVREIYEKIIPEIEKKVAEGLSNGSGFSGLAALVCHWQSKCDRIKTSEMPVYYERGPGK